MAIAQVSKIVPKSVGNPKIITTLPDTDTRTEILLGRIIGVITGTVTRKDPTGEKEYKGLKGQFKATPAPNSGVSDPSASGICYFPEYVQDTIIAMYEGPEDKRPKGPVKLAVDVYTIKATNAQGYSWKFMPLIETEEIETQDPLALLEKEIAGAKKLPAPDAAKPKK